MSRKASNLLLLICCLAACQRVVAADDLLVSAGQLLHSGKYEDAAKSYRTILITQPASADAHAGLALALLKQDKVAEALASAKAAMAQFPDAAVLHAMLGEIYFRKGWISDAEQEFRKALKLDHKQARAWLGLARVADIVCKRKTAKKYYDQAHALDAQDPDVLRGWAGTLKSSRDEVAALEQYLNIVPFEDPDRLDYVRGHMEVHKQLGDRKLFQLASDYVKAEIPLESLMYGPTSFRGLGLQVSINGGKPLKLLLDTGATGLVLNRKAAEKYGVKRLTDHKFEGIGDKGPMTGYAGLAERVRVGNVEFRDCLVYVSDQASVVDEPGLIGTDVFSKFLVTLDFRKRLLRLDPLPKRQDGGGDDDPYDRVISPEMKDFTPVFLYGHGLLITTTVGDAPPALFLIDTGSGRNIVSSDLAKSVTKIDSNDRMRVRGISGDVKKVYNADRIIWQFGRFRQEGRDITALDFSKMNKRSGLEISGIMGLALLGFFEAMVIDYRDGLVDFRYKP
jgi:tetratricopeptide (TPR) repeat protein